MSSTYLSRNQTGNTYTRTWTLSWWFKRSKLGTVQRMWTSDDDASGNNDDFFQFQTDDSIQFGFYASGYYAKMHTNRKFRDTNAWYHCVFAWDSTQTTASDRIKVYINGVQETSWLASDYPSQNSNSFIGGWSSNLYPIECGRRGLDNTQHFDGSMSHCHFTDGTAYDASAFGETDATTGEWKIKTSPSVTYGTNGFFILKDGNSVTDQSGQGNNFTVGGGTLTKTEDNPSNVFATGNSLIGVNSNGDTLVPTFSNGNNTATATGSAWRVFKSTLSASSGKYYAEFKWISDSNTRYAIVGIYDEDEYANKVSGFPLAHDMANGHAIYSEDGNYYTGGNGTSFGSAFSNGSIIGVAMDLDNSKIYFSKDGTWQGSANPTNATGGKSITANKTYTFGVMIYSVGSIVYSANYGNGYFGTTAVSSAGTNASGNGIFEYDVPTGYTALSTKGLNL